MAEGVRAPGGPDFKGLAPEAPLAPVIGRRSSSRSRAFKTRSTSSNPIRHTHAKSASLSAFGTSKKDKRIIKRSALISRIEKSKHKQKKRRRPSKKLVVSLESLADALPEAPSRDEAGATEASAGKIRHRSLKSQPGSMKKKEKIIRLEKDRFNQNMAQLTAIHPSAVERDDVSHAMSADNGGQIAHRWAALKNFIQQNVQQRPSAVQASTLPPQ
ncbi:MAG: hypothetical protein LQ350_005146 [Teloschistes chrysophthalmus]|nr:MAG: hypothetical protein LQ350_005146 [Niorma chrysophthalma]